MQGMHCCWLVIPAWFQPGSMGFPEWMPANTRGHDDQAVRNYYHPIPPPPSPLLPSRFTGREEGDVPSSARDRGR